MTDTDRIAQMAREAGFSEAWVCADANPPNHPAPIDILKAFARLVAEGLLSDEDALAELMAEHLYGHPRSDAIEWAKEDKFDSDKNKALELIVIMRGATSAAEMSEVQSSNYIAKPEPDRPGIGAGWRLRDEVIKR